MSSKRTYGKILSLFCILLYLHILSDNVILRVHLPNLGSRKSRKEYEYEIDLLSYQVLFSFANRLLNAEHKKLQGH